MIIVFHAILRKWIVFVFEGDDLSATPGMCASLV